jgi:hypothetical protein
MTRRRIWRLAAAVGLALTAGGVGASNPAEAAIASPSRITAAGSVQSTPASTQPAQSGTSASEPHTDRRRGLGEVLGALFVVVALLFWSFGYGLLGGRIVPLSLPLRRD